MRRSFVLLSTVVIVAVVALLLHWARRTKVEADGQVGPRHEADVESSFEPRGKGEPAQLVARSDPRQSAARATPVAVVVRTVSSDGAAIDDASVDSLSDSGIVHLGKTRAGRLEVEINVGVQVRASKPGFEEAQVAFTGLPVELVLEPKFGIHGYLVDSAGAALGEGFRVLATPTPSLFLAANGDPVAEARPAPLVAETDAGGQFYLPTVQDFEYRIHAGGKGMLAAQELRGIIPGPTPLRIELHDVLAARVRLVDSTTGEDPIVCKEMWSTDAVGSTCLEAEVEVKQVQMGTTVQNLLDLDKGWSDPDRTWIDQTVLCFAVPPRESVGPFEYRVSLPGYSPAEISVHARPVRMEAEASVLPLVPTAKGWGSLTFSISGVPNGANQPVELVLPAGFLKLQAPDGGWLDLGLPELSEKRLTLTGLPFGSYSARVQLAHGMGKVLVNGADQAEIEIGPSDLHLDIGMAFVGAVELELRDAQGRGLDGPVHASLKSASGRSTQGLAWKSAPYVVQAIAPGRYAVEVSKPVRLRSADLQSGGWVDVVAGTTSKIRISVP